MGLHERYWDAWLDGYRRRCVSLIGGERRDRICDLGCGDGSFALSVLGARKGLTGVENHAAKARRARNAGFETVVEDDLNTVLDLPSDTFDVVFSHFVVEHLVNVDTHLSEALRILKPGGVLLAGTENLSSWHNILALMLGQEPFTMTIALSPEWRLGNKLQGGRMTRLGDEESPHCRVFAYQGLADMLEVHGFCVEKLAGAGSFPLPGRAGDLLGRLDPRRAALIVAKARKPL
ncbi:hypothetical protein JCM15519_23250 [Fundidesulfovibrio butyratiphilus]